MRNHSFLDTVKRAVPASFIILPNKPYFRETYVASYIFSYFPKVDVIEIQLSTYLIHYKDVPIPYASAFSVEWLRIVPNTPNA